MYIVDLLSQFWVIGLRFFISRSSRSLTNQVISAAGDAMALYSASELDLKIVPCFLDFQEIGELPRNMMYPITDLLESTQEPQSLSQKPCRVILLEPQSLIPWPYLLCIYGRVMLSSVMFLGPA